MSKLKRILALMICLLMTLTSIPVSQFVLASTENNVAEVVTFDKTFNYSSTDDALADGWSIENEKCSELVIDEGFPTLEQTSQIVITNNKKVSGDHGTKLSFKLPVGPVAIDADNGTKIINEDAKYHGIVKIDIEGQFDALPTAKYTYNHTYTDEKNVEQKTSFEVGGSYNNVSIMGNSLIALQWRVKSANTTPLSHSSEGSSDIVTSEGKRQLGGSPKDGVILSSTINTDEEKVSAVVPETGNGFTANGSTWANVFETTDLKYIDRIEFTQMIRAQVGSFSKIKGISVTTIDPKFGDDTTAILEALPKKLVNDIDNVTEDSVTLKSINGVKWSSLDESVAVINGNELIFLPSKTEAKEARVKATFTTDGIKYSKEYTMTVASNTKIPVYYYVGDKLHGVIRVDSGEKVSAINAPEKSGYNFDGWYLKDATEKFDFEKAITEDTNLYAQYSVVVAEFPVNYYVDGSIHQTVMVESGKKASDIDAPEKSGYNFDGWYLEGATEEFDFETAIIEETNLYAKYTVQPISPPTVTNGVVSFNKKFAYSNVSDANADGWSVGSINCSDLVIEEGFPTLKQTSQIITTNNTNQTGDHGTKLTYKLPAGPVVVDEDNRTTIINEDAKYHGIVKVDIEGQFDALPTAKYTYNHTYIEDGEEKTSSISVNGSYSHATIMGDASAVQWRVKSANTTPLSHSNSADNDIKITLNGEATTELGGVPVEGITMSATIDTNKETISATTGYDAVANGSTWAKVFETTDLKYIDRIEFTQMIRAKVGSFSKIKGISVTTIDPQFGDETTAVLSKLPAKLPVGDINAVKVPEFELEQIEGVTWSTSDESLVKIEGSKAIVNRVKGVEKEVEVKATFTTDEIKYSKIYKLTLAPGENMAIFYDINGKLLNCYDVKDGEKAYTIAAPEIEHYNFLGWYEKDSDTAYNFDTVIYNTVALYAKYEVNTYNVIFKADGVEVATLQGEYNDVLKVDLPAIPAKEGYTGIGWFIGDTDERFSTTSVITGPDMVVNARYTEGTLSSHKIEFKVDGVLYHTDYVTAGYTVLLPQNPLKDNYVFDYWALNGKKYNLNLPVTKDLVLEAVFSPKPITVKFYMDEAMTELHMNGTGYYNMAYGKLPIPKKTNYKLVGWKYPDGTDFTENDVITQEISVYAVWEYTVKTILDEDITKYTSRSGNLVEFLEPKSDFVKSYFDNGYLTKVVKSTPSNRDFVTILTAVIKVPVGDYDETNRTMTYSQKLVGDYEIIITFDGKLAGKYVSEDGYSVTSAPYGYFSTGGYSAAGFSQLFFNRIFSTHIQSYNSNSGATNTFNNLSGVNKPGNTTTFAFTQNNGIITDNKLSIRYDTFENYGQMTLNDREDYAWGVGGNKMSFINGFYVSLMQAFKNDDFINIKNVKVVQYNDYSYTDEYKNVMKTLESLPATLSDNPYEVVEDISIPTIKGVIWSSSNEKVISSTTGEVTPWYDDTEVVITASLSMGSYSFQKEYKLTVKAIDNIQKEEIIIKSFNNEESLKNWTFVNIDDSLIGTTSIDENGLKVSKLADALYPEINYELKKYFAFYDLYDEVETGDNSITEVKDHKGVYDLTIDFAKYSNSSVPMNIAVGYRDGNSFYDVGILKISKTGVTFGYQATAEKKEYVDVIIGDNAKLTFRIDNINNEISLYSDGVLITERLNYVSLLGDKDRINSFKVELDSNNVAGDSITIKNVKLVKVLSDNFTEIEQVKQAANKIDVYDITSTPNAVSNSINSLPKTIDGYKVDWSVSSNQIDLESGEVFHDETANKVYVYAEIYDVNKEFPVIVRKTFELNIRAAQAGSDELDKFNINSIGKITNQSYDSITYDLNIPEVEGVQWSSSNTAIIGKDGKIVDNVVILQPTPITITASSNGVEKEYKLTVLPRTPLETIASGNGEISVEFGDVENAKLSGNVVTSFTYIANGSTGKVNVCDDEGKTLVSFVAENDGFYFDYLGSDFKKHNLSTAKIDIITLPGVNKAAIYVDGKIVADYVDLKYNATYVSTVTSDFNELNIKMSADKYAILQANIDNINYFDDVKYGYVDTKGFDFVNNVITNAEVKWISSNKDILKDNGDVVVPKTITYVNLQFVISDKTNTNIFIERNFNIAVDCDKSRNIIYGIEPLVNFKDPEFVQSNLTDGSDDTLFKAINTNIDDFDIVFNLGAEKSFNSIFVLLDEVGLNDYEIYSSTDGESWALINTGNMNGELSKLISFENDSASYIKFVIKKCSSSEVTFKELKAYMKGTDVEFAQLDFEYLVIDTNPVDSKINLPKFGQNGTALTWESSNVNIIDLDGNIIRQSNDVTVTLTAKAVVNGKEFKKAFDVYVSVNGTSGPTQVGGGAGVGGGGTTTGGASTVPVIGGEANDTVYGNITESEDNKTSTSTQYYDVTEDDWYYDAVVSLTDKGVISGDGTGSFNPKDNVTREQFVKMILEALEIEMVEGDIKFTDIDKDAWYVGYITTAHQLNIVNGLAQTRFGIGSKISRQDMAVLIERVLKVKNLEIEKSEVSAFADASNISEYAIDAVENMKAIGLIKGYNNMFNPKDNLTRAEAATVIASLLELLAK